MDKVLECHVASKTLLLKAIILTCMLAACASTSASDGCTLPPVDERALVETAISELERHGGRFKLGAENTEYKVTPVGCEYLVMLAHKPARPGDAVVVRIDRAKKVVRFVGGS